jgi:4-azaleucine resistance transporter AzlC
LLSVTTLLLNLRLPFSACPIIRSFPGISHVKPYLVFALTDETYALLTATAEPERRSKARYYFLISLLNHLYWVTGTLIGALLGQVFKTDLKGMEFALTALFVVLAIEQYRKIQSIKPFIIGAFVGIVCLVFIAPKYMLLASILSGTTILLLLRNRN